MPFLCPITCTRESCPGRKKSSGYKSLWNVLKTKYSRMHCHRHHQKAIKVSTIYISLNQVVDSCASESTRKAHPRISPKAAGGSQMPGKDLTLQEQPRSTLESIATFLPCLALCSSGACCWHDFPCYMLVRVNKAVCSLYTQWLPKWRNTDGPKIRNNLLMEQNWNSKGAFNETILNSTPPLPPNMS